MLQTRLTQINQTPLFVTFKFQPEFVALLVLLT